MTYKASEFLNDCIALKSPAVFLSFYLTGVISLQILTGSFGKYT